MVDTGKDAMLWKRSALRSTETTKERRCSETFMTRAKSWPGKVLQTRLKQSMALSLASTRSFLIVFFKLGTFCYATRFVVRGFEVLRALPGLLRVGLRCDVNQKCLSFFFSSSGCCHRVRRDVQQNNQVRLCEYAWGWEGASWGACTGSVVCLCPSTCKCYAYDCLNRKLLVDDTFYYSIWRIQ